MKALGPASRRLYHQRPQGGGRPLFLSSCSEAQVETGGDPLRRDPATARVEAVLMLAEEPLSDRRLAQVADLPDASAVRRQIERLRALYDLEDSPFTIVNIAGGRQLLTRPRYQPWLLRLRRASSAAQLSSAALETLAIVAYRQPITRAALEGIRGVQCDEVLRHLMERGFLRIAGREDSLGRPVLYGTTKRFLQAFGLNSLKDLPEVAGLSGGGHRDEREG